MNFLRTFAAASVALLATAGSYANASIITSLSDNFSTENGGVPQLNYYGFTNFTVGTSPASKTGLTGSVDLIGVNSGFDAYPGHGLYVDMCGSTNACGSLTTKNEFAAGTYNVSLTLGGIIYAPGNGYGAQPDGVNVSFGGTSNNFYAPDQTIVNVKETVTLANAGVLTISDLNLSGNENIGATLLSVNVSAVPLPGGLALFGSALLGIGALARRRAKKAA